MVKVMTRDLKDLEAVAKATQEHVSVKFGNHLMG